MAHQAAHAPRLTGELGWQLLFAVVAIAWASIVATAFHPQPVPALDPPAPKVRVTRVQATAAASATTAVETLQRIETPRPEQLAKAPPVKTARAPQDGRPRSTAAAATFLASTAELPPQPATPVAASQLPAGLPLLTAAVPEAAASAPEPPPAAPGDSASSLYPDVRPGGSTLVIALLLNDSGDALDTRIVIASDNPLGDLSYVLAARQTKFSRIDPPLAAGELRWLEVRFDYPSINQNVLP